MLGIVLILQGLAGFGVARRLVPGAPAAQKASLAFLLGLPISSLAIIALDVLSVRITPAAFGIALAATAAAANMSPSWVRRGAARRERGVRASAPAPRPDASDFFFGSIVALLLAGSVWDGVRLPVTSRDAIVGMDLVAKYAVAEGRIDSGVFTGPELRGQLSNQPFYAPFTMLMQVAFRLAGLPFGKLWPNVLFVSFTVFLYSRLRSRHHAAVAGFLTVLLVGVPSLYSSSHLVITDFANALFVGLSVVFFRDHAVTARREDLALSSILMAAACWSRSETVVLVPFGATLAFALRRGSGAVAAARSAFLYAAPPLALFALWHGLYYTFYLDQAPPLGVAVPGPEWRELGRITSSMIRLLGAPELFGSFFYVLGAALVADLIILRQVRREWILGPAWMVALFVAFVLMVYWVPAASVEYTVKRGYLKLVAIGIFCIGESAAAARISRVLQSAT
jgi:hypothetical protein